MEMKCIRCGKTFEGASLNTLEIGGEFGYLCEHCKIMWDKGYEFLTEEEFIKPMGGGI